MSVLVADDVSSDSGYQIQRSLRLRASASARLDRTPGAAGSLTTWTWSGWVRRGSLGAFSGLFGRYGDWGTDNFNNYTYLWITAGNTLVFGHKIAATDIGLKTTTQLFRDPSAWYHVVAVFDTTNSTVTDRMRLYVNGSRVTAFGSNIDPAQNTNGLVNSATLHNLGAFPAAASAYTHDGYLSEVNFIDGQALTPSSFGQFDPTTGQWVAKKYTGTYGTNGFYLDFSTNTSATTLAYDKSGNGNNWTPTSISTTNDATYDSMFDVPSGNGWADGGNGRGNYSVFSPLWQGRTNVPTNGNLDYPASSVGVGTIDISQFNSYWEITSAGGTTTVAVYGTSVSASVGITAGLTYGFRFTAATGALDYTTNGSSWTSLATGLTSGPYFQYASTAVATTASLNSGQRPFTYTLPTGFKALHTGNLPAPTIQQPNKHFDAVTQLGSSVSTGAALLSQFTNFTADFAWGKDRAAVNNHQLVDTVRGNTAVLQSNTTSAETTYVAPTTGDACVAWGWKAGGAAVTNNAGSITSQVSVNTTAGVSVVTYTGTGVNATVGHGLGVAPKMLIVKDRDDAFNWVVWHSILTGSEFLRLNTTDAKIGPDTTIWNGTLPSSSVFNLGANTTATNVSTKKHVAYCFAETTGFSKFDSYTGNGSADGPFVYCGFRPKFVLVKSSSAVDDWRIYDSSRPGYNVIGGTLLADTTGAETTAAEIDFTSNGFKLRVATMPNAVQTYIFAAFAETPFNYSNAR